MSGSRSSNHSKDHGFVSCSTHQPLFKQQLASWSVSSEISTIRPFIPGGDPSDQRTQQPPEDATSALAARKEGAELGHVVVGTQHSLYTGNTSTVESSFICNVAHAPRTRLDASECPRFGIQQSVSKIVSKSLLRCSWNCKCLSHGLIHQGSPRSCVHGAVTV